MDIKTPPVMGGLFVGTWALKSLTETLSDGSSVEPMGRSPQGFLLYTEEGIVSAQVTGLAYGSDELSLGEFLASDGNQGNATPYIGYCGTFTVNFELQEVVK